MSQSLKTYTSLWAMQPHDQTGIKLPYDEVCEIPPGAILLSSDKVNNVMGLYFLSGKSQIWGLQYHPDYEYWQLVNLSNARKDRILKNNHFKSENEFQKNPITFRNTWK